MGLFRCSLGEDNADRYNHTHSVIFFLVLALVTWLLPLSPHLQPQDRQEIVVTKDETVPKHEPSFKTKANCWCPSEFTSNMVNYANAVCGSNFVRAMNGQNGTDDVSLYEIPMEYAIPIGDNMDDDMKFKPKLQPKLKKDQSTEKPTPQSKTLTKEEKEQQDKADDAWRFIHVTTPTALFLLALAVMIPHLLYSLLVGALAGINVDQTLAAATAISGESINNRREMHKNLAMAAVQHSGRTAGNLYLLLKLLACVAAITSLIVVHGMLLPQASRLGDDLQAYQVATKSRYEGQVSNSNSVNSQDIDDEMSELEAGKVLLCEFPLRQLQNLRKFTLQCLFSMEEVVTTTETETDSDVKIVAPPKPALWKLYETLFLIVQTYLIVLTILNVTSLVLWAGRLLVPSCSKFVTGGLNEGSFPLDAVFLLQMAHENAGPEVVQAFAQSGAWSSKGKSSESIPLQE